MSLLDETPIGQPSTPVKPAANLLAVAVLCLAVGFGGGGTAVHFWNHPVKIGLPASSKVTAVTYVYEKDDTAIPSEVETALSALNGRGILASPFEQDTTNGKGETPAQYKTALAAAKTAGLPALVVQAGDKVLRVVKAPTTAKQVEEAAK